jgi:flagellar basal body-associated protein FliL
LARDLGETPYQMKSSTKKILVIGIIVLFIVSIVAGVLGGHL